MSGTLGNPPSKGDKSTELREEIIIEEAKQNKKVIRKAKSFGGSTDRIKVFPNQESKGSNSGVRLVWRTASTADLESLNKVLGISSAASKRNRSPSPNPVSQPRQIDHVFSENFNPLAVQKRDRAESEDSSSPTTENRSRTPDNNTKPDRKDRFKRQESNFKHLEMPSVKSLKHLFEKIKNEKEDSTGYSPVKRSHTVSSHEFQIKKDYVKDQRKQSLSSVATLKEENISAKDIKEKTSSSENIVHKSTVSKESDANGRQISLTRSKSKSVNIESEPSSTVKSLLNIFERSQSIPSDLKNITTQNRKLSEKTVTSESVTVDLVSRSVKYSTSYDEDEVFENKSKIPKPALTSAVVSTPEIREEQVDKSSASVLDLRKKWENLVTLSSQNVNKKSNKEKIVRRRTTIPPKTLDINQIENETTKRIATPQVDDNKEEKIIKQDPKKEEESPPQPANDSSIRRGQNFRSSVKNMTLMFENKKTPEKPSKSAPTTPVSPPNEFNSSSKTTSPFSPITSIKMNKHPPSKSLENLKRKFSTEIERERAPEAVSQSNQVDVDKANSSMIEKTEKSEISLASLERRASVKNMKKKFEITQVQNQKTTTKREESFKSMVRPPIESSPSKELKNKTIKEETKVIPEKLMEDESRENKNSIVKIELNSSEVDIASYGSKESDNRYLANVSQTTEDNKFKVENLMKDFLHSEGLSKYLEVPKDESLSPALSSGSETEKHTDISQLMKATDTFKYPGSNISEMRGSPTETEAPQFQSLPSFSSYEKDEKDLPSPVSSHATKKRSAFASSALRSGSRELKPDELKFFKGLGTVPNLSTESESLPTQGRERSLTIESSSPTSTLSMNDRNKSKLRSSSRQFRDLHTDELRFFGVNSNGTLNKKSSRSGSETSLHKETLETVLRSTALDEEGERKE